MEEREIHLRDYLRTIYKRRYTVYTFFIIVFIVVLIGTLSTTPIYRATTSVLIEKSEAANMSMMYPYYFSYDPAFYETQYQLIRGASVARKVVEMIDLEKTYGSYFPDEREALSHMDEAAKMAKLTNLISGDISVSPIKDSKIVNISYMSESPEFAALIANSVAKAYISEILDMKMSHTRYALEWMTKKAEEEKTKLEKSERALQAYMRANDIVTLQDKIAITPERLSEFNSQLIQAQTKRKELESLYRKVKKGKIEDAETIPAIAVDPTVASLRSEILKAEQNIEEFSKKYGQKHPTMIRAREDLKTLKEKREQQIKRVIVSIKNEYELAKSKEDSLRSALSGTKAEALSLNEKFIQYGVLLREVETNRQLYDALIKRMKEQSVTEEIQTVNVWVVEKAGIPGKPVRPKKSLNILLGIIVGLFGGIGLTFFFDYLDNTIKSPDDVETRLGLAVLGMVPLMQAKEGNIEELLLQKPQAAFSEHYKNLRTALLLSSASKPPQNILVTSMGPEEGKTVTSVNLALTVAESDYSVLLIDGDLRKPRVHSIFGLNNAKGLSTYLAGTSTSINIIKGPKENLSIIPAGPLPPNPSELLGSYKLHELIRVLKERYNIIIWDSPPLMTVTDSLILSKVLDGTVIVTKAGKTTFDIVRRGLKAIRGRRSSDSESRVLGIVINAIDVKKSDYYYYKHYYHSYYSSKEE
jgi:capsular exopolysaccharide synthesis family protein